MPLFSGDNNSDLNGAESLGEFNGGNEDNNFENDMMSSYDTLNDSSEEGVLQRSSKKPTSSKLHPLQQIILPTTSNTDFSRRSTRIKRAKPESDQKSLSHFSPGSSSEGEIDSPQDKTLQNNRPSSAKDSTGENVQKTYYHCKMRKCSVVKSSEKDLFEHVRVDHSDRNYRCDACPMAFKILCQLTQHKMVHSGQKPHECDKCGMKFTQKCSLVKHQQSIHNEKALVSCLHKKCRVRVPKNELYEHIRTAHPKEQFQCNVCPMSFKTFQRLTIHERTHNGNKPYKCEICGKKFFHASSYKLHLVVHTGERAFNCEVCGKAFSRVGDMKVHMRTHTGEKPFQCSFCEKYFTFSSNRSIHELTCSAKQ